MATASGPAEALRLRPGVAFVPGVGLRAPPARHSVSFSFTVGHLPFPGSGTQIAPPGMMRGRGEVDSLPCGVPAGYAPPGPPALRCVRSSPNRPLWHGRTSPPPRRAHAPHAMPRGCAGAGSIARWSSVIESFSQFVFSAALKQKSRRRCLPKLRAPRRVEVGRTSGRDSRESQSVNGRWRVVNPLHLTQRDGGTETGSSLCLRVSV
jgi:hypothetical protein